MTYQKAIKEVEEKLLSPNRGLLNVYIMNSTT